MIVLNKDNVFSEEDLKLLEYENDVSKMSESDIDYIVNDYVRQQVRRVKLKLKVKKKRTKRNRR